MKAWYSKVRDTELIDGSVRADYVVTFETDKFELKRKVEKYLQGIMDEAEQTEPQADDICIWNVCNYNKAFEDEPSEDCELCKHFKYRHPYWECEFDTFEECNYEPKTEPQTERSE